MGEGGGEVSAQPQGMEASREHKGKREHDKKNRGGRGWMWEEEVSQTSLSGSLLGTWGRVCVCGGWWWWGGTKMLELCHAGIRFSRSFSAAGLPSKAERQRRRSVTVRTKKRKRKKKRQQVKPNIPLKPRRLESFRP